MPGSAVPTFAVRPLVAENTATSVDENALKATTTPAIADPASHSGLATPRLVVLDDYFGSRTRVLSLFRALPFSVSATAFTLVPDSFPTTRENTVQGRSPSSPGPKSVVPDGSHVGDSVAPAGLKCERGDQGRLSSPRLESPKRLQQAAAAGNPELFWKGGAQTPRQGLLSAFPGLASLAYAALCPSSPLHQRAMQHYPRLVHHLPQRSGRTGIKKSWPTTGRFSMPPRR